VPVFWKRCSGKGAIFLAEGMSKERERCWCLEEDGQFLLSRADSSTKRGQCGLLRRTCSKGGGQRLVFKIFLVKNVTRLLCGDKLSEVHGRETFLQSESGEECGLYLFS
jgi:hypothetical protein